MSKKRAGLTTKEHLENASLPNHKSSYCVISHKFVIDNTKRLLEENNLIIEQELYRSSMDAEVAQGIYHLEDTTDPELGMMFAWANSYNKQMRFKCAIGAYVKINGNSMIAGDYSNYGRVHKGTADADAILNITDQIKNAHKYYSQLIADKKAMKGVILTERQEAEILGRLFIQEEFLDLNQLSIIRKELKENKLDYGVDKHGLWAFYNHVITALKVTNPKAWLDRQKQVHWFLCNEFGIGNYTNSRTTRATTATSMSVTKMPPSNPIVPENQLDLEKVIEEVEKEQELKVGDIIAEPIVIERSETGKPLVSVHLEVVDFSLENKAIDEKIDEIAEMDELDEENIEVDEEKTMERANPETYEKEELIVEEPEEITEESSLVVTPEVKEALHEIIDDIVLPIKAEIKDQSETKTEEVTPEEQASIDAAIKAFSDNKHIDFSL